MTHKEDAELLKGHPELSRKQVRLHMVEMAWRAFWTVTVVAVVALLVFDTMQARAIRNDIADCNTESGECYERTNERLENAIDRIYDQGIDREQVTRRIILLAAACAGDTRNRTTREIERCVNDRLIKDDRFDFSFDGVD